MSEEIAEHYPPSKSCSGSNAYYHFCHIRGGQQNYGVCMHIIKAIEEDRIGSDSFVDCQRACTRDDCQAKKMRAEEIAAGRALYYKERTNINPSNKRSEREAQEGALIVSSGKYDMTNPSFARGWNAVGAASKSKIDSPAVSKTRPLPSPTSQPKPQKKSGFVEESMADLVNVIARESKAQAAVQPSSRKKEPDPAAPSAQTTTIKPLPGETPVEFARRRRQLMQANA